jgi:hypothetical protein
MRGMASASKTFDEAHWLERLIQRRGRFRALLPSKQMLPAAEENLRPRDVAEILARQV